MARPPKVTIAQLKTALTNSRGIYTGAAAQLHIDRRAVGRHVERSKTLQRHVAQVKEATLDLAQTRLAEGIDAGNMSAIIFYLKCIGKHLGFVERQELTGRDGAAIELMPVDRVPRPDTYAEWSEARRAREVGEHGQDDKADA